MFSMLYPDEYVVSDSERHFAEVQQASFLRLGLDQIVGKAIAKYFTYDSAVLARRKELFRLLISSEDFRRDLSSIRKQLADFNENLNELHYVGESTESKLRSMLIATDYLRLIETLHALLVRHDSEGAPDIIHELVKSLQSEIESEDFACFRDELARFDGVLDHVKSITVGVNLDAELRPTEAGLLSINDQQFKSGNRLDCFLRLEFKRDEYCTIAPLASPTRDLTYKDRFTFNQSVSLALERILKETATYGIKQTAAIVRGRMQQYLGLLDELYAIEPVIDYIQRMSEVGLPLCVAEREANGIQSIEGLYDPKLCKKIGGRLTQNDLVLTNDQKTVILTGQNSGGKTVLWRALATAKLFASLGIPICAKSVKMDEIAAVYVAFSPENADKNRGRLDQECAELGQIMHGIERVSEVYLDEPFSSTAAKDAVSLLDTFTDKLRLKAFARLILTTHFREYARGRLEDRQTLCLCLGYGQRHYAVTVNAVCEDSLAKEISDKYW